MDKETLISILKQKDIMLKKLRLEREKLIYYANIDGMTGVLNRRFGLKLLGKKLNLSKINGNNLVVCFVDIDRLKMINDVFGHKEGDKILKTTAKILKGTIRKSDFIIRMGGDEFLLVFPKTTKKEANKIWHRISRALKEFNNNRDNYNLSLSYGFYEYSKKLKKKITVDNLIVKADAEMYKRKLKKKKKFGNMSIINTKNRDI